MSAEDERAEMGGRVAVVVALVGVASSAIGGGNGGGDGRGG